MKSGNGIEHSLPGHRGPLVSSMTTLVKGAVLWFPVLFIGLANGLFKESTYGLHLPELLAHQLLCVLAILLFWTVSALIFFQETSIHAGKTRWKRIR